MERVRHALCLPWSLQLAELLGDRSLQGKEFTSLCRGKQLYTQKAGGQVSVQKYELMDSY